MVCLLPPLHISLHRSQQDSFQVFFLSVSLSSDQPGAVDEKYLKQLEESLAGAQREVDQSLKPRFRDMEKKETAMRLRLDSINSDIDTILGDIANLEDILRTVPNGCFNNPPIEQAWGPSLYLLPSSVFHTKSRSNRTKTYFVPEKSEFISLSNKTHEVFSDWLQWMMVILRNSEASWTDLKDFITNTTVNKSLNIYNTYIKQHSVFLFCLLQTSSCYTKKL